MNSVALGLLTFVAVMPALAGCDPSLDLISVQRGCPNKPLRGPEEFAPASPEAVIDDFDDNDLLLKRIAGRVGSWVGFATPGQGTVFGEASDACVAHGTRSGHLTGTDITSFGSNWNAVLIDPFAQAVPFDASAYSGFSFWIAAGDHAAQPLEVPMGVMTVDTSGGGGICDNSCGDYYRVPGNIPLTRTWTRWVVKFSDLAQTGQPGAPQVPLRTTQLVSLMFWPQKTYDIWIDDVRFEP